MLLWAAASGFLVGPLQVLLWEHPSGLDDDALVMLVTLLSGVGCTCLAFAKADKGLWSFVKVSAAALLVYYLFVFLAAYILYAFLPSDAVALLPLAIIVGYLGILPAGLLLGWLGRLIPAWRSRPSA